MATKTARGHSRILLLAPKWTPDYVGICRKSANRIRLLNSSSERHRQCSAK